MIIPNNIKKFREDRGLSQADVAEACDCAGMTVSKWERHMYSVGDVYKIRLCQLFGCEITDLFDWRY